MKTRKLSTRSVRINTNFAAMVVLSLRVIGKKFTSLFRHASILKTEMYSNGSVEMRRLFDCLGTMFILGTSLLIEDCLPLSRMAITSNVSLSRLF